jgi:hypothetical protein
MKHLGKYALALLVLSPTLSLAASVSPGKASVWTTQTGVLDMGGNFPTVTAQILKGKAKSVLEIHVDVSITGNPSMGAVFAVPNVNGGMPPSPNSLFQQCSATSTEICTVSGVFWLDLDAAEAASPGTIVGQPLNINLQGGNWTFGGAGAVTTVTLTARMIKK